MILNAVAILKPLANDPWLIVGKGPSLALRNELDLSRYSILTLNHACRYVVPRIAHFTDLEAYAACEDTCQEGQSRIVLPWHPHVEMTPGRNTLDDCCRLRPALDRLRRHFRLASYNSTVAHKLPQSARLPTIRVRYFSAVAAVNLLLAAGVKRLFTLGVDGGTAYAPGFDQQDRLANGRPSFDVQFGEIRAACKKQNATLVALTEER